MSTAAPGGAAESSLLERAPDVLVPGVLSLDRLSPCNHAALEVGPPVTAVLPPQRWAYGVVFPLDPGPLRTEGDQSLVVSLDLAVEGGTVGILGVGERLELATTVEAVVGPGRSTACLTLDRPARTAAVVLRNVGEAGEAPRVTVTTIGAYRGGPWRLSARRHDLGFDLFVVLSPGKSATQTVEQTLLALAPGIQVRRVHRLSEEIVPVPAHLPADNPTGQSATLESEDAKRVSADLAAVRAHGGRVAFVTAVREPVDGAIAGFFHSLPYTVPGFEILHAIGPEFVDLLARGLTAWLRRAIRAPAGSMAEDSWFWRSPAAARWFFGGEFRRVTGVDLLEHRIDREAGFTIVQEDAQAVLVFRFEDIARGLAAGLAALTGRRRVELRDANRSDDKAYRALYREFRARFRIPRDLADEIYDHDPYLRHLYTPAEIAAFKARWT